MKSRTRVLRVGAVCSVVLGLTVIMASCSPSDAKTRGRAAQARRAEKLAAVVLKVNQRTNLEAWADSLFARRSGPSAESSDGAVHVVKAEVPREVVDLDTGYLGASIGRTRELDQECVEVLFAPRPTWMLTVFERPVHSSWTRTNCVTVWVSKRIAVSAANEH
jgi:hypothetical protein